MLIYSIKYINNYVQLKLIKYKIIYNMCAYNYDSGLSHIFFVSRSLMDYL